MLEGQGEGVQGDAAVVEGRLARIYTAPDEAVWFATGSGLEPLGEVRRVSVTTREPRQIWVAGAAGVAVLGG